MIFTKKALLGSLSFATVLMVGNWSGAIAQDVQKSPRYLSDQEIQALKTESLARFAGGGRYFQDRRPSSEISKVSDFVNAWQKADPSISPFLGNWAGYEESLAIYPSQTKGQVCMILTFYDGSRTQNIFNLGKISGNKLLTNGGLGKRVIVKDRGTLKSGETIDFIAIFGILSGRNVVGEFWSQRQLLETSDSRLARFGCTASLPSNNQAQISTQTHPAGIVVSDFYNWYFKIRGQYTAINLSQQKQVFTPELYRQLVRGERIEELYPGRGTHFNVFDGTQVSSYSFQIDSVVPKDNSAEVYVTLQSGLRYPGKPNPIKVLVVRNNNRWQIADFVYLKYSNVDNLMSILRRINQKEEFSNVPWESYEATPSIPQSSLPVQPTDLPNKYAIGDLARAIAQQQSNKTVQPTDTIAKYPTNDDFEKVDRILQASSNPESLVNLKGNQQNQRRKFQKEWESRNPAAAKFLGGWYTGNKSFYVYPSTAKGGTCVVTKDYQGNLTMQIGTVLNKELRYGGGKGFFWIDRENIVASRDSGNGDLYPIYATYEVPELPASIISDMESQKCITALPSDTVASTLPSPLYEDVTDPAFKLSNLYRINGMTKTFRVGLNAFDIVDNGQTVKLNSTSVKPNVPTIIITHGWKNDPSSSEFREFQNLIKAVKYNSSMQVLVVDWGQGAKTGANLDIAAARIEATAGKVADLPLLR